MLDIILTADHEVLLEASVGLLEVTFELQHELLVEVEVQEC